MYIPPEGIYFRLLGQHSQWVLFSRDAQPYVGTAPASPKYDDQYFTLVPGTGEHKGAYLIRSKMTKKVLFSRVSDPFVGDVAIHDTDQSQYYSDK